MLTKVDREVLISLLLAGDNTPSNIAEMIGRHTNSVRDSIDRLGDENLIETKGSGVYRLTYQGCNTARTVNRKFDIDLDLDRDVNR